MAYRIARLLREGDLEQVGPGILAAARAFAARRMTQLVTEPPHIVVVDADEPVWRVGFKPEPWAWSGWEWAGADGRFDERWDDRQGNSHPDHDPPVAIDAFTPSSDARTLVVVEPGGQRCFEPAKPLLSLSRALATPGTA